MSAASSPLRVVIADDTPDIRELLRIVLERAGFEVVAEAADGLEAVEVTLAERPDVVLLDLAMPRMDGLEVVPHLTAQAPRTKILVLSGFDATAMEDAALARGAHGYLQKGIPPAQIVAAVREVCAATAPNEPPNEDDSRPETSSRPDLLSTLTHELRNQLTLIEGYARLLLSDRGEVDEVARVDHLRRVVRNAVTLRTIIDTVTTADRLGNGSFALSRGPVDLPGLVEEVLDDHKATDPDHAYVLDIREDVTIEADALRVNQVLTNLLSNAAKFSPRGTPVQVTVDVEQAAAAVSVSDDGPGIAAEHRDALFRPFSRIDASAPGTGLGLYISRGIARAHGGDLSLADVSAGACFVLRLPLMAPETEHSAASRH